MSTAPAAPAATSADPTADPTAEALPSRRRGRRLDPEMLLLLVLPPV
ncbi:MAG: hypothetical protein JHD04_04560, partial [Nocardioides sp.]|nr:hypothetical protein [Nocardioides sp.]